MGDRFDRRSASMPSREQFIEAHPTVKIAKGSLILSIEQTGTESHFAVQAGVQELAVARTLAAREYDSWLATQADLQEGSDQAARKTCSETQLAEQTAEQEQSAAKAWASKAYDSWLATNANHQAVEGLGEEAKKTRRDQIKSWFAKRFAKP